MSRDIRYLHDIVAQADEMAHHLAGLSREEYVADLLRQRATERLLTMMGEAAKQLSAETRQAIPQPWREIIRLRDKGIHNYDSLSPGMTYDIATQSVPALRDAVRRYLAQTNR